MKYYCINGPSPHSSMWDKTGGDLRFCGYISPESLERTRFESSNITKPEITELINEKTGLEVPTVEDKIIKGVQIGDHLVCFCTEDEKVLLDRECESVRIKDYVVIKRSRAFRF